MRKNISFERRYKEIDLKTIESIEQVIATVRTLDPEYNDRFPEVLTAPWNKNDEPTAEYSSIPLLDDPSKVSELQHQAAKVREELGIHPGREFDFFQMADSLNVYVTTIETSDASISAKSHLLIETPFLVPSIMVPMKSKWENSPFKHILILNDTHSPEALRFNAVKRMSHLLLGHQPTAIRTADTHDYASANNLEANTFATLLLLPTVQDQQIPNSDMFSPALARARLDLEDLLMQ